MGGRPQKVKHIKAVMFSNSNNYYRAIDTHLERKENEKWAQACKETFLDVEYGDQGAAF